MGNRLSVARHFSAVLCERPVRSQSRFVSEIKWSLFGLASLAIALRLLTRSPLLHGAGLGWDDASISLAYVFLVAEEAGSEISKFVFSFLVFSFLFLYSIPLADYPPGFWKDYALAICTFDPVRDPSVVRS